MKKKRLGILLADVKTSIKICFNNMTGLQGQEYFGHPGETVNIKVRKRCKPVSEFSTKTPNTRTMPVNIQ